MKNYKNKITYWQNKLNNAINCAPAYYSEENITRALSSLTYFVNKQKELDFPPVQAEEQFCNLNQHIEDMNRRYEESREDFTKKYHMMKGQGIDEAIAGELF